MHIVALHCCTMYYSIRRAIATLSLSVMERFIPEQCVLTLNMVTLPVELHFIICCIHVDPMLYPCGTKAYKPTQKCTKFT